MKFGIRNLQYITEMKRITAIITIALFSMSMDWVYIAPPPVDTTAKIRAMFLYNFTKNIEWPKSYKEGNFIIGILGTSALRDELQTIVASKKVGNVQDFMIQQFFSAADIKKCHMLYVTAENSGMMKAVQSKIKGKATLLVAEKPGMAKQGAAINFIVVDSKQKFELNKANAERYSLKVSNNLTSLAILVE